MKSDRMVEIRKKESIEKEVMVINTIKDMAANNEKISFTTVYKKAGVSKGYVYQNDNIRKQIEHYLNNPVHSRKSDDSKDSIIEMQRARILELEKEHKLLERYKDELEIQKEKNRKLNEEIKQLKKQLSVAYKY